MYLKPSKQLQRLSKVSINASLWWGYVLYSSTLSVCMYCTKGLGTSPILASKMSFLKDTMLIRTLGQVWSKDRFMLRLLFFSVACSPLTTDANVFMNTSSSNPGDIVQFYCKNGQTLSGSSAIYCRLTGSWSGPPPSCVGGMKILW